MDGRFSILAIRDDRKNFLECGHGRPPFDSREYETVAKMVNVLVRLPIQAGSRGHASLSKHAARIGRFSVPAIHADRKNSRFRVRSRRFHLLSVQGG
jgi:hypothetical protein